MKTEDILLILAIVILVLIMFITVVIIGQTSYYQGNAIEHGCAQYSPTTGEFEWIKREDK
jgi:hypothetical protein